MKRIIIDTDPGVDDVFAIALAGNSTDIKIEGITTVSGNCSLENAIQNTFKALDLINKKNIPVYKGIDRSLKQQHEDATDVFSNNGMGGVIYTPINTNVQKQNAIDYLIETVNNNPNQITIVAIGPLTNIACAINKSREFVKNVDKLIIMGGSAGKGNITPHAEFNFYKDPEAANIVFSANFKEIIMSGWDVTTKLPLNKKYETMLKNINNDVSNFLFDITRIVADFDRKNGYEGAILSDPLTIAYLIDDSIVKLKPAKVNIELSGDTIGKSNVQFTENSNCKVACDVDVNKFYKLLFKNIFNADIK